MTHILILKEVDPSLKYLSNLKLIRGQQFISRLFAMVKLTSSLVKLSNGAIGCWLPSEAESECCVSPEMRCSDSLLITDIPVYR